MIKVSFIAIFLAAIGYKEYNPSVVGKWESSTYSGYGIEYFKDGTFLGKESIRTGDGFIGLMDSGTYSLFNDTLVLKSLREQETTIFVVKRQNKRKLILKSVPLGCVGYRGKSKFKRID